MKETQRNTSVRNCFEVLLIVKVFEDLVEILRLSFIPQRQRTVERVERALHTVVVEPGTVSPARPEQFFIQTLGPTGR